MKISALLRVAASRVSPCFSALYHFDPARLQEFSCHAIMAAAELEGVSYHEAREFYTELMAPRGEELPCYLGFGRCAWLSDPELAPRENQSLRMLALLFAAKVAEDEGL